MTTRNPLTLHLCGFARNHVILNFKSQILDFKNIKSGKQNKVLQIRFPLGILILILLTFSFLFTFGGCKKQSEQAKKPTEKEAVSAVIEFPEIEGWKLGEVKTYKGDELYVPIDGEADRYFPFGFEQAYFASYKKADGKGIVDVQIYQMNTPDNAYGIYTMYDVTSPDRDLIKNDVLASTISGAALDFVKSLYFVRISQHEMDADKDLLVSFGDSIAQILQGKSEKPKMIALLPAPGQIKYFRRWETYRELNYDITENIFNLSEKTECVLGKYVMNLWESEKKESELLIVKYPDAISAENALERVKDYLMLSAVSNNSFKKKWASAIEKNYICVLFYDDEIRTDSFAIFQKATENIKNLGK